MVAVAVPQPVAANEQEQQRTEQSVRLAGELMTAARLDWTPAERKRRQWLARLLGDRNGLALTLALTDRVLRVPTAERAADLFAAAVQQFGVPGAFAPLDRLLLRVGAALAPRLPGVVMPLVAARIRRDSAGLILPAEPGPLSRHIIRRRQQGFQLNINLLGEAILGEEEADRRAQAVRHLLARRDVTYISVKISALASRLDVLAFEDSVQRVAARLRPLLSLAASAQPPKFVNMDMEEYHDLSLTLAVFRRVLDEPAFERLEAGIALQAYLPDSHAALDELAEWAQRRYARTGAGIKVRLVKGANLAMERVEAELHGWPQAPYLSKADVDASYKRLVDRALRPETAVAVRTGIASHNLFDVAWAALLAHERGVEDRVDFEMLEGMAESEARQVRRQVDRLVLYAPVTMHRDFANAAAYLVRRFDENAAPENYLHDSFALTPHSPAFTEQAARFRAAVAARHQVSTTSRRQSAPLRAADVETFAADDTFANQPDSDFTIPARRREVFAAIERWQQAVAQTETAEPLADSDDTTVRALPATDTAEIPLVINGDVVGFPSALPRALPPADAAERADWSFGAETAASAVPREQPRHRSAIDGQDVEASLLTPQQESALSAAQPGGGRAAARRGSLATGIDPNHPERPAYHYALAGVEQVDRAVAAARAGLSGWQALGAEGRRRVLRRCAVVMQEGRAQAIACMAVDGGKTVREADAEVSEAVDFARYYGDSAVQLEREVEYAAAAPLGVVVVTPPWNFPYAIPAGGVLAALAAGSTVILKPAPETVRTAWLLACQLWQGGVPPTALHFLPCPDNAVGQRLVTHDGVDAVMLTGSWETARLFLSWKPELRLHAETSGKNALLITAAADLDLAVRDLVRSAFGHGGQKCSAASLAIVEAVVYDNPAFLRRLGDAVRSLRTGPSTDPATDVGPLIRPPEGALERALTRLEPGESWLVEPRQGNGNPHLWRPGVKLGVQPGSWSHYTEWFGPVLGVMRAPDLDTAITWQNAVAYGLTAGLHSLDHRDIERWAERVEAGNAYINRHTTGAIVRRQPFGGWKRSSIGPGAKAGGPNYVATLQCWTPAIQAPDAERLLDAAAASYQRWWRDHFSRGHDPSGLTAERNIFRYRPLPRGVLLRVSTASDPTAIAMAQRAAAACGARLVISVAQPLPSVSEALVESDEQLAARLAGPGRPDRLRLLTAVSDAVRSAALDHDVAIDDDPFLPDGRLELLHWLREQVLSITNHRYGNVEPERSE